MDRKDLARRRTLAVIANIAQSIKDNDINVTNTAKAVGISPASFYRWLNGEPQKVDLIQIATLADYLHDNYGLENFAALWRRVERDITE